MPYKYLFTSLTMLIILAGDISIASARSNIDIPDPLKKALTAYMEKGVKAFLPALFSGPKSPEKNSNILDKTDTLIKVESIYGHYTGLELVESIQISDSTRIVFFIMKYQRGPLYGVITTYKSDNDKNENITGFKVHTEIHKIIPKSLLSKYVN